MTDTMKRAASTNRFAFYLAPLVIAVATVAWAALAPKTGAATPPSRTQANSTASADEEALRQAEEHWLQFEEDPEALQSILADDFVHALSFGFITKAEQIAHFKNAPAPAVKLQKHFEDLRVRVYGDTGIANGIVVAAAPDGSVRKTVFTDVFVRRGGKWLAVNAQELLYSPPPGR